MDTASHEQLKKIEQAYDSPAWWYDVRGFFILTFAYRSGLREQVLLFGKNMGPQHLEAACGSGTLLEIILRWRRWKHLPRVRVVAFDYAEPMLTGARRRFRNNPDVTLLRADAASLDFPENSFDTANIANAVHCFPEVEKGLREVRRVLRPTGTLAKNVLLYPAGRGPLRWIATRINEWGMRKGILFTPYAKDDIRKLLGQIGFEILQERVSGNTYNVVARKTASNGSRRDADPAPN